MVGVYITLGLVIALIIIGVAHKWALDPTK